MRLSDGHYLQHGPPRGGYRILGVIADGGTGVVYRATDTALGWEVALKVLHDRFEPDSAAARRFADAALIMGQLQHPGIPQVHNVGSLPDGRPFFAMKLIRGITLHGLLESGPHPVADRARFIAVFEKVCEAVAYAHAHGVVHRDLKPAKVLVGAFGEVFLLGWGSARVAGGSSPEQADGGTVDRRADVFGLGEILATILTGRSGAAERLKGCGADPGLAVVAKRCLSPDPADRPKDAGAVRELLFASRTAAEDRVREAESRRVATEAVTADRQVRRRVQLRLAVAVVLLFAARLMLALASGAAVP